MNLLLHTNHPKLSGLKQHYWIIWAHEPNDLGCAPLVALTFCDRLLSTKLDGSGCWLVVGWAHSSLHPAEGPGLDLVETGRVLTVEIEAAKPPDAQAQNCYNVILDACCWPQYVTRPAQTQRHGNSTTH